MKTHDIYGHLGELISRGAFHGSLMINKLYMMPDAHNEIVKVLQEAESEGLIERGTYSPTMEQTLAGRTGLDCHYWTAKITL
jgi:hypothetical protein